MTLDNLEAKEMEYVEELKHRLEDVLSPEMYEDTDMFKRFLRARSYNLKASENMLRNDLNWRKANKIDTISSWFTPHEVSDKFLPLSHIGYDKEGFPVFYFHFGGLDARGCLKSVKLSEFINNWIYHNEWNVRILEQQSIKLKKRVDKWSYIFNFENLVLSTVTHKPTMEGLGKLVSMYEAHYPERLKLGMAINASWYFQVGYALIKPLISAPTQEKIKIFGKDCWKEELLKLISADVLPAFLGGNRTDPDGNPLCKTFIKYGGLVPERYYAVHNKNNFITQPNVRKLQVHRLSKGRVELQVLYPSSNIEWEFQTKDRDISFTLFYKDSQSSNHEAKELIPKQRADTSICPEVGVFKCEKAGTYYLEFDNSYSWIHQKEVHYKVEVVSPHFQRNAAG